jgi:hypothetical protein
MPPALYAMVIFERGSHFITWAGLDHNPPIYVSLSSWDHRHVPLHPAVGWDGVSQTFCLGGLQL